MATALKTSYSEDSSDNAVSSGANKISEGTEIVGTVKTSGDIRIDGKIDGSVTASGNISVGETGKIKGDLLCNSADILGVVEGKINAKDVLTLKSKSKVVGEITIQKLIVESGAIFNGTCKMGQQATASNNTKPFESTK